MAPYADLRHIVPPHKEVYDAPPEALPHRIVGHTSMKVCAIVAVELVLDFSELDWMDPGYLGKTRGNIG